MANYDLTGLAVKMVCPTNEVITDDRGIPGIYVQRNPRTLKDLITTEDDSVHPAFKVNGAQISRLLIGKYQGKDHGSRIYSLPGEDPRASIDLDTYVQYCKNKGDGHHCITAAEWAFLALCAKKDGKMPKGNNQWGRDVDEKAITAIPTYLETGSSHHDEPARVATGTGPLTWSDTGDLSGIWDLNGNIWEWVNGIRLVKGELQVIPDNDAADPECDTSASSNKWKAINADATAWNNLYVTPSGDGATPNTVRLDFDTDHWQWQKKEIVSSSNTSRGYSFQKTTMDGLSEFCQMYLRAMALAPEAESETNDYGGDWFWANNAADERCASRGGGWGDGAGAGVFDLNFRDPRSCVYVFVGGRPAFYE